MLPARAIFCCWSGVAETRQASALHPIRIALKVAGYKTGATVDGEVRSSRRTRQFEVDNMEGIGAHVTPEGDTVLTM